jgi:hypothetical protein
VDDPENEQAELFEVPAQFSADFAEQCRNLGLEYEEVKPPQEDLFRSGSPVLDLLTDFHQHADLVRDGLAYWSAFDLARKGVHYLLVRGPAKLKSALKDRADSQLGGSVILQTAQSRYVTIRILNLPYSEVRVREGARDLIIDASTSIRDFASREELVHYVMLAARNRSVEELKRHLEDFDAGLEITIEYLP